MSRKIERLARQQIVCLYPGMKEAFPENELKSLKQILRAVDGGTCDCFGMTEEGTLIGYAFFVRTGEQVLFDYFSVLPEYRNRGYGAVFLSLLTDYFNRSAGVIAEVEDPDAAENGEDRAMRSRRLAFYLRNGFSDTGVRSLVFGVRYILLVYGAQSRFNPGEVRKNYRRHYRAILPRSMVRRFIRV